MSYAVHLLVVAAIYALLALSLDLSVGLTALLSISHGALFGVGAYTAANALGLGVSGPVVLLLAAGVGLISGSLMALLLRRLGDDYFAVATFALQAAVTGAFFNLEDVTGGASGMQGFGQLQFLGFEVRGPLPLLAVTLVLIAILAVAKRSVQRSPLGRLCATLREDEVALIGLGHDPVYLRVLFFAVGAAFAAIAGALYAAYIGFLNPIPFGVEPAIGILACVVLGGAGSTAGPIAGAVVFIVLPEALRFVGLPSAEAANIRAILFGAALILAMIYFPSGLMGRLSIGKSRDG